MPNPKDIADRLEAVGIDDYTIDLERGIVFVYHKGLLEKETPNQTPSRQSNQMAQIQITLTPNLAKKELVIGIQTGD
ncbi:MAG: hypothetical protein P4L49_10350 [Desulfosporosinus sp.]|nr:hypothetical protein [Desulfosporosinus sp.]